MAADFLCLGYRQQVPAFWLQGIFVPVAVGRVPDRLVRETDICLFASYCLAPVTMVKHSQMKWGDLANPELSRRGLVSESWRTWREGEGLASSLSLLTRDASQVNHLGFGFLHITAGTLGSPWMSTQLSLVLEVLISTGNESSGCALWQSGPRLMLRSAFRLFLKLPVGDRWAWDHSKCICLSLQLQKRLFLCYFVLSLQSFWKSWWRSFFLSET